MGLKKTQMILMMNYPIWRNRKYDFIFGSTSFIKVDRLCVECAEKQPGQVINVEVDRAVVLEQKFGIFEQKTVSISDIDSI